MTTILQINSARLNGSHSTPLATALVQRLATAHPDAHVIVRDLQRDPLPYLDDTVLGAFFTPAEQRNDAQRAIVAQSDALIAELQAADVVVLTAPMYNFTIPAQLKSYFDWIARAGVTFRYTAEGQPEGLVKGKTVFIVTTRGGAYEGTPNDSQLPYLKTMLGFLGMNDVNVLPVEKLAFGPEAVQASLSAAHARIAAL